MTDKELSQYDLGSVLRSAHEDENQALRVTSANTSVPPKYSRVDLTYSAGGSVTNAKFYKGTFAETREIKFSADISGSLNNTYFTLYSENDESLYHVWYNVGGAGVDPAPVGSCGIEIQIETNDAASIVALATKLVLDCKADFKVATCGPEALVVTNVRKGPATDTVDVGTGFMFLTRLDGAEKLLKSVDVPDDGVVKYLFNTQEKKFEVISTRDVEVEIDADDGDNIAISRHENFRNIVDDSDFLKAALSTTTYTNLWTYVATENIRMRAFKVKADTFGSFRVKVDGDTVDYYQTSPTDRNCRFFFMEDQDLLTGETLTIEFLPDRLLIPSYNFFFRIEGYNQG